MSIKSDTVVLINGTTVATVLGTETGYDPTLQQVRYIVKPVGSEETSIVIADEVAEFTATTIANLWGERTRLIQRAERAEYNAEALRQAQAEAEQKLQAHRSMNAAMLLDLLQSEEVKEALDELIEEKVDDLDFDDQIDKRIDQRLDDLTSERSFEDAVENIVGNMSFEVKVG